MKDMKYVGKRIPLIDGKEKVTGAAAYCADTKLPRMVHGKILRSPYPHARILNIDTSRAEKLPGVKAITTGKDVPPKKYGAMIPDQFVLAVDRVRYVGDEVAAVAAIDEEMAMEALELIKVDYEELPGVFDVERAVLRGAPQLHDDKESNYAQQGRVERGDVEKGFAEADYVFEDRFATPTIHQSYIEPNICIASWDNAGKVTFWAPNQLPFRLAPVLSEALGIPVPSIRIVQTYVGGGFGGKARPSVYPICALLAQRAGRPVRIIYTREEELIAGLPEASSVVYTKIGVKRDGTLTTKESHILINNGAYTNIAPLSAQGALTGIDNLYRWHNVRCRVDLVYTNTTPTGMYRGPGGKRGTYAQELLLDEIAEKLGMDPVELRLKNASRKDDISIHGYRYDSCGLSDCIAEAAQAIGWEEKREQKQPRHGVGLACYIHRSGSHGAAYGFGFYGSNAIVKINGEGKVTISTGEPDLGTGSRTIMAQVAADELGMPIEDIEVEMVDTATSPFGLGAYGSRVTALGANAVKLAAEDARKQITSVAAEMLEADPDDLELAQAKVFVKGSPDKAIPLIQVARFALSRDGGAYIEGRGTFVPSTVVMPSEDKYGNVSVAYPFAAHAAEVEVDTETGRVTILNYAAAQDLGRAVNPMFCEGQIHGGVAQGIGYALSEEVMERDGRVQNASFHDYKIATALDMPPIESVLVEPIDPNSPLGVKGLGEVTLIPAPAAVANAVYNAIGVRMKEPPITPEKVLQALREGNGR